MNIYACSRASIPERLAMWHAWRVKGVEFSSTWLNDALPAAMSDPSMFWLKVIREIAASSRLVLYVEKQDLPLRGAFVEIGIALAHTIPVYVVAPDIEIDPVTCYPLGNWMMHPLVRRVDTLDQALENSKT